MARESQPGSALIGAAGSQKRLGDAVALTGVSLEVPAGPVLGVVGPITDPAPVAANAELRRARWLAVAPAII